MFQSVSNCFRVLHFPVIWPAQAWPPYNRVYDRARWAILRSTASGEALTTKYAKNTKGLQMKISTYWRVKIKEQKCLDFLMV